MQKSRNTFLFAIMVVCLFGSCTQGAATSANDGGDSTKSSLPSNANLALVERYFPNRTLPLEIDPNEPVPQNQVLRGAEKLQLFPAATDGDIRAIAKVALFPGMTTVVYQEDWLNEDVYIVTFPEDKVDLHEAKVIAGIFSNDEEDGYYTATLRADATILRRQTIDGETFEEVGTYRYSPTNEMK